MFHINQWEYNALVLNNDSFLNIYMFHINQWEHNALVLNITTIGTFLNIVHVSYQSMGT